MKLRVRIIGFLLFWLWQSCQASTQPLVGLRVPVDHYPDGTLKHELTAGEARALDDGTIEAQAVVVKFFTPAGKEDVTIRAAQATVDRVGLRGHSLQPVSLVRERLLLTGEGFEWNGSGETIRILRNVRLTFPSEMFKEKTGATREDQDRE